MSILCERERPRALAVRVEPEISPATGLHGLPRAILAGQACAIVALGALHAAMTWAPEGQFHPLLVRLFDVDREMNLPTWFSSTQWLLVSLTLLAIAILARATERSRFDVAVWALGAAGALYLSADETAVLHERIGTVLEELLLAAPEASRLHSMLAFRSYYWIVAYLPIVLPLAAGGAVFLWKRLAGARVAALFGIFLLIYAAIGLDFIEGRFGTPDHAGLPLRGAFGELLLDVFLVEELLEMIGTSLLLYAFLRHLSPLVHSRFSGGSAHA